MKAMVIERITDLASHTSPLVMRNLENPQPKSNEVRIRVSACGVCHTELDEIEGRTPPLHFPMVLGHQVVGKVDQIGSDVKKDLLNRRVGVGWIFDSCGVCRFCQNGDDNLCPEFRATGRDALGGFAEFMTVPHDSVFLIPERFSDYQASPLLCAGAIGYRSLNLAEIENGQNLGLTGFGASGHLVLKMAKYRYPDSPVFVFARSEKERRFALELGAVWACESQEYAPERLHAVIDTTPVWRPVVEAMKNLAPGGRLIINAIRKEEGDKNQLLNLNYAEHLWMEKEIKSVANVARKDIRGFLELADRIPLLPEIEIYPLEQANRALLELKQGKIRGAKVLKII